jgi:hypothetical protein
LASARAHRRSREQQVVDNLAEIKADYDPMRMTDAMEAFFFVGGSRFRLHP